MKRIFLDTNVLLDVLLDRHPFSPSAQLVWTLVEKKSVRGAISALSLNNVFFIIKKLSSSEKGYKALEALVRLFDIVDVGPKTIRKALEARFPDFEDAVQYYAALQFRAQAIVSRDSSGFLESKIPVMDCAQYLAQREP